MTTLQRYCSYSGNDTKRGTLLVTVLLLVAVVTLTAIVALSSSRQNVTSSTNIRNKLTASNAADTALNMALTKIRGIPDWVASTATPGRLHKSYNPQVDDPTTTIPNCEPLYTWSAADHQTTSPVAPDLVSGDGRSICNFLGSSFPDGYVSVVRQTTYGDPAESFPTIPYLVTAIVKTKNGMVVKQAAVLNPLTMQSWIAVDDPNVKPYIAAEVTIR